MYIKSKILKVFTLGLLGLSLVFIQIAMADGVTELVQEIEQGEHVLLIVDGNGDAVLSPTTNFDVFLADPLDKISTGVLGFEDVDPNLTQKIYIGNGTAESSWSVNFNAVIPGNPWSDGVDVSYPYQDNLMVDPTTANITYALAGCGVEEINKGSIATFDGLGNPIDLVFATSAADIICGWYVTGISLEQNIPGGTPDGIYSLPMVLTML